MNEDEIEVVDQIADDANSVRIETEATRLGLSTDELIERVVTELKARISNWHDVR